MTNQPTPTSRREKIEALLRDDPDDVFLRYSLALEMEAALPKIKRSSPACAALPSC